MKGIYLTPEAKKALEDKMLEIEKDYRDCYYPTVYERLYGKKQMLKEILSSAIVLPVVDDYCNIQEKYFDIIKKDDSPDTKLVEILQEHFKHGIIIIQP